MTNNKTAVVTGSTGGIGSQIANKLASRGLNLILVNRSKEKSLEQVKALQLKYPKQTFEHYEADFTDLASVTEVTQNIQFNHPSIYALFNVAGYMTNQLRFGASGIESQFAVNALSPYILTQGLRKSLAQYASDNGNAVVVNFTTSMIKSVKKLDIDNLIKPEKIAGMGMTYAAAKLAVNVFNQALVDELQQQGIQILAVDPGPTRTPMTENMEGIPWLFKKLMPLMTKDVHKQTDKLMTGVDNSTSAKQSGLFISEGKIKKEHPLALNKEIQTELIKLLDDFVN